MGTSFAAVLYRPAHVSERALSHGFGVATAGFDIEKPSLSVGELAGLPGWSVAFYRSGAARGESEHEHACDLFDEELPPGLAVLGAADTPDTVLYSLVFSDELVHDDGCRFAPEESRRRYVRDAEEGIEAGREDTSGDEEKILDHDASDDELRPHRGSTFLSECLGTPVLPLLVRALFEADKRVAIRLVAKEPEAIAEETRGLNRTLRRQDGRGAFACADAPAAVQAFVAAYDWADPSDSADLYRELAIGNVKGTLFFYRDDKRPQLAGLYALAALRGSSLGGAPKGERVLGLDPDEETLWIVDGDKRKPAGPTLGELLAYLRLGWSKRDEVEEDFIGALMLRAKIRADR
jgi:hypothetical protein